MSPGTVPGSGEDGEQPPRPPLPGNGQPGQDADAERAGEAEWDGAAEVARLVTDIDAGLIPVPDETGTPPQTWFSLAGTSDPAEVDVAGFAQGRPLNARPPDAVLAAVAEMAADPAVLRALDDNQVLGLAAAGRRLAARGAWVQQAAVAEFAARRTEPDRKKATGYGFTLFAPDELAPELVISHGAAEEAMARARDATRRLPACSTLLRNGLISAYQLQIITDATAFLDDVGAAEADLLLAAAAPGLTPQALRNMCTRTVMNWFGADPQTRWCATVIGSDGTAAAHGCAPGPHPWTPERHSSGTGPDPPTPADQAAQITALLHRLKMQLSPIAKGTCDHRHHSDRYVVPRTLKHLVKARASSCTAPGCNQPSAHADADHTIPWPQGPSCECNLGAPCRYHHRNKQAAGWRLTQPEPGVMVWQTPSGRRHATYPTKYVT